MPYEPGFDARSAGLPAVGWSASPVAMARLAETLGYRMVGANVYGFQHLLRRGATWRRRCPRSSSTSSSAMARISEARTRPPVGHSRSVGGVPPRLPPLSPVAAPDRSLPVAVFDSGVGGLTVLHECLVSLPHEDFLYLGDTARFPYGDRTCGAARASSRASSPASCSTGAPSCSWSPATRPPRRRCRRCATSSSASCPVVAVVGPESRLAARATTANGQVGLIATPATVNSGAYAARARARRRPQAELHAVASAELAPLIQEGGEVDHRTLACVEGACRPLKQARVDTVILGCTHYPLVRPVLQRELGPRVTIVSSGEAIAAEVGARLDEAGLSNDERPPRRLPLPRHRRSRSVPPRRHPLPAAADRRGRARRGGDRRAW